MSDSLDKVNDFMILPVIIPTLLKLESPVSTTHHSYSMASSPHETHLIHSLFVRPHESSKSSVYPPGRTLFIVNVPVDCTVSHLQRLFRHCGTIDSVEFHGDSDLEEFKDFISPWKSCKDLHRTGSNAHVVFENRDALERVMSMKPRKRVWGPQDPSQDSIEPSLGLYKWIKEYLDCIPETESLQKTVDQELVEFEELEKAMRREALAKRNVPDADGFITVTRAGGRRNTNRDALGASVGAVSQKEVANLKPKNKELKDFYRFQMKENKRNELAHLRQKFELDKKRIQDLKKRRKFKPY